MMTGIPSNYTSTTALNAQSTRTASAAGGLPGQVAADPSATGAAASSSGSGELALRGEQRVGAARKSADGSQLSPEQERILQQMRTRDREVRAHERAHQSTGAGLAGGASFKYERGPDGQLYAVAGEVKIDTSQVKGDPQANLQNAETVLRAALAPIDPSGQDLAVAARARAEVLQAKTELSSQRGAESDGTGKGDSGRGDKSASGVDDKALADDNGNTPVNGDGTTAQSVPLLGEKGQRDSANKESGADTADGNAVSGAEGASSKGGAVSGTNSASQTSPIDSYEQRQTEKAAREAERIKQQEAEAQRAKDLADYQQQMADLQKRLTEVQQKLADMGVLDPKYLIGSVINAQV